MNIRILTPDGHNINAIHETSKADRAVLLCHGITSDKNEGGVFTSFAKLLNQNRFDNLRFDFRGHGESAIRSTEATIAGMIVDLDSALSYLVQRYAEVHVLAASFGASIVLLLTREELLNRATRVCFWNPVTDYESTFTKSTMPWGKSFFPQGGLQDALRACPITIPGRTFKLNCPIVAELYYLSPAARSLTLQNPLLVIHGADDELVDPRGSTALVQANRHSSAELVLLDQCGHGLEQKMTEVYQRTLAFFER